MDVWCFSEIKELAGSIVNNIDNIERINAKKVYNHYSSVFKALR